MQDGELQIMVRRAFLFYFLKQLELQVEGINRPPEDQHSRAVVKGTISAVWREPRWRR